jgi:hypothetical protein
MNVLFDKAVFVILVEPEFVDYKYLEIGGRLTEIEMKKFFQTNLSD